MTECTKRAAFSQYPKYYGFTLAHELGQMFSTLSVLGISIEQIEEILRQSRLMRLLEHDENYALADSDHYVLAVSLFECDGCSFSSLSHLSESDYRESCLNGLVDWLVWWSVETIVWIAKREHIAVSAVLDKVSFAKIMKVSPRYHTFPPSTFYDEIYCSVAEKEGK